MTDDMNKKDIQFLIDILGVLEGLSAQGLTIVNRSSDETVRTANMVKLKLYRMRDGIDIKKDLKKLEQDGGG